MSAHVYTIRLVRYIEGDEYENDRTDDQLREQVAKEIQEGMDQYGLPAGFFNVESVVTVSDSADIDRILGRAP